MNNIKIKLTNQGESHEIEVPAGSDVGIVREPQYAEDREEVGAPTSFSLSINGKGVEDNTTLSEGDVVGFRPVDADKGA